MRILAAVFAAVLAGLGAGSAAAQQFSADLVATSNDGQPRSGKIYVSGTKLRMEPPGGHSIMLVDSSANTAYALMPQQKAYIDAKAMNRMTQVYAPLDPNDPCPQWQKMAKEDGRGDDWSCKRLGNETVNGRNTIKYEATSSKGEVAHAWIDPQLKFLVKADSSKGGGMELRNIVEAPQPDNLFIIPADYQKLDMQQMMQRMMQQHGGDAGTGDAR